MHINTTTLEDGTVVISTGAIGGALGITLPAIIIEQTLGIPRHTQVKAAIYWRRDQFSDICRALAKHANRLAVEGACC